MLAGRSFKRACRLLTSDRSPVFRERRARDGARGLRRSDRYEGVCASTTWTGSHQKCLKVWSDMDRERKAKVTVIWSKCPSFSKDSRCSIQESLLRCLCGAGPMTSIWVWSGFRSRKCHDLRFLTADKQVSHLLMWARIKSEQRKEKQNAKTRAWRYSISYIRTF